MTTPLLALAVLLSGPLAGLSLDRSIVALPAWRRLGVAEWAAFSRRADLGNGLVLYPLLGLAAPAASVAAAVAYLLAPEGFAVLPVYLAAILGVAHVVATARAAPQMARVRGTNDADELRDAFVAFERWQRVRAVLQAAAFVAGVWALSGAK